MTNKKRYKKKWCRNEDLQEALANIKDNSTMSQTIMPTAEEMELPPILRSTKFKTQSFKLCSCACKWRCQCLIPREKKPGPPFNIGVGRDNKIGLHPKLYTGESIGPPVGAYDPKRIKCKPLESNWAQELKTEEFAATMGGRELEQYTVQRHLMRTGRGPGTHEIAQWPEAIINRPCRTIKEDIGFGTVPLFKPAFRSTTPGPGHTKKNPYYYMNQRERIGSSTVPTFHYDGCRPRFRSTAKSWMLPCNLYDVKHPDSLQTYLKKVTGKRGPYDLFTGPRDETTFAGYQLSARKEDAGNGPYSLPSELDKLMHKSNYFKGLWTTCPRFPKISGTRMMLQDLSLCYKDPKQPGPGHYDPGYPKKTKNMKNYPFDSNIEHVRPSPLPDLCPGPGRYKIADIKEIKGHGWTWVFKSKSPRTNFIIIHKYNAF